MIVIVIVIHIVTAMKTVQMTMEADLIEQVDRCAKRLGTTRSAFARVALREALRRLELEELEQQHISGYRKFPPMTQEFDIPDSEHAWGDDAWSSD